MSSSTPETSGQPPSKPKLLKVLTAVGNRKLSSPVLIAAAGLLTNLIMMPTALAKGAPDGLLRNSIDPPFTWKWSFQSFLDSIAWPLLWVVLFSVVLSGGTFLKRKILGCRPTTSGARNSNPLYLKIIIVAHSASLAMAFLIFSASNYYESLMPSSKLSIFPEIPLANFSLLYAVLFVAILLTVGFLLSLYALVRWLRGRPANPAPVASPPP